MTHPFVLPLTLPSCLICIPTVSSVPLHLSCVKIVAHVQIKRSRNARLIGRLTTCIAPRRQPLIRLASPTAQFGTPSLERLLLYIGGSSYVSFIFTLDVQHRASWTIAHPRRLRAQRSPSGDHSVYFPLLFGHRRSSVRRCAACRLQYHTCSSSLLSLWLTYSARSVLALSVSPAYKYAPRPIRACRPIKSSSGSEDFSFLLDLALAIIRSRRRPCPHRHHHRRSCPENRAFPPNRERGLGSHLILPSLSPNSHTGFPSTLKRIARGRRTINPTPLSSPGFRLEIFAPSFAFAKLCHIRPRVGLLITFTMELGP